MSHEWVEKYTVTGRKGGEVHNIGKKWGDLVRLQRTFSIRSTPFLLLPMM
jgi:hypothetical protein